MFNISIHVRKHTCNTCRYDIIRIATVTATTACLDRDGIVAPPLELLTADGIKMEGCLKDADETGFSVLVQEKQKVEGKKRPQLVEVEKKFGYSDVKWVKSIIDFK